jgi:hypothetical protein
MFYGKGRGLKSVGTATHWRIGDKRYGDITKKVTQL